MSTVYNIHTYISFEPVLNPKIPSFGACFSFHPTAIYSDPPTTGGVLLLSTVTPPPPPTVVLTLTLVAAAGAVVEVVDSLLISIYNFVFSRKDTVLVKVAIPVSVKGSEL